MAQATGTGERRQGTLYIFGIRQSGVARQHLQRIEIDRYPIFIFGDQLVEQVLELLNIPGQRINGLGAVADGDNYSIALARLSSSSVFFGIRHPAGRPTGDRKIGESGL